MMKIELSEKPKKPIIIQGSTGLGMVGVIATEFLIKHLNARKIGRISSDDLMPAVAIHESKLVDPLGIFYSEDYNLVIIHTLSNVKGLEWKISQSIIEIADILKAKEIICLESLGDEDMSDIKTYYLTMQDLKRKQFESYGIKPFKEGMVMGITGALLLKKPELVSAFFVEAHVELGDNKAAAKLIELLDKYLQLKVDFEPLIKAAEQFEEKLKSILEKGEKASLHQKNRELNYFG